MEYIEFTGLDFVYHESYNDKCLNENPIQHAALVAFQLEATRNELTPQNIQALWEAYELTLFNNSK